MRLNSRTLPWFTSLVHLPASELVLPENPELLLDVDVVLVDRVFAGKLALQLPDKVIHYLSVLSVTSCNA